MRNPFAISSAAWFLAAICLALLFPCAIAVAQASPELMALERAHAADANTRNAVYLLLRVAGTIWIAAEWVAAAVLVAAYRQLRAVFTVPGGGVDP